MALDMLRTILCCFRPRQDDYLTIHSDEETSRLLSQPEAEPSSSNAPFVDQQKLQERLGMIVRAKEGKMVNVGSQIPFNLHNQVLPERRHKYYGSSRSTSVVSGTYTPQYGNRYGQRYYDSPRAISLSPTRADNGFYGQPPRNPILNVRLVKFESGDDKRRRGRSRERRKRTGLGVDVDVIQDGSASEDDGEEVLTPLPNDERVGESKKTEPLKLRDMGSLALSWGE